MINCLLNTDLQYLYFYFNLTSLCLKRLSCNLSYMTNRMLCWYLLWYYIYSGLRIKSTTGEQQPYRISELDVKRLFRCISFLLTFGFGFQNNFLHFFCGSVLVFCHHVFGKRCFIYLTESITLLVKLKIYTYSLETWFSIVNEPETYG